MEGDNFASHISCYIDNQITINAYSKLWDNELGITTEILFYMNSSLTEEKIVFFDNLIIESQISSSHTHRDLFELEWIDQSKRTIWKLYLSRSSSLRSTLFSNFNGIRKNRIRLLVTIDNQKATIDSEDAMMDKQREIFPNRKSTLCIFVNRELHALDNNNRWTTSHNEDKGKLLLQSMGMWNSFSLLFRSIRQWGYRKSSLNG